MEKTNLNLIPEKEKPIVNASQFDDGRVVRFILKDGEGAYIPVGGESVACNIRKPDNNVVTISCTLTSIVEDEETVGSYVDVVLTDQANACVGEAFGELVLTKGDDFVIGTCNFVLAVERSPIAGGVTSTTVIDDLYTQVEEITVQVIGDDYYTKTQVDDLLDLKADAATTYTKTEVDNALALKADASSVYTKTQVDTALALKADASSVYTKTQVDTALALKADASDVYTKTQVDNLLLNMMPVGSASGAIANFDTDLSLPLVDCKANIVATGGNGTPDNPNPINGYTEANITRCGKNMVDKNEYTHMGIGDDVGTIITSNKRLFSAMIAVVPSQNYHYFINGKSVNNEDLIINRFVCYDRNKTFVSRIIVPSISNKSYGFTVPSGVYYIVIDLRTSAMTTDISISDIITEQFEIGTEETAYVPYNTESTTVTIAFGQTVYGGVLDVTRGKLKPCIEYPSYNGETLSGRWLSSEATYIEGTTPPTGSQVVSLDDYGTDIDLTPVQINALMGVNNVFNDTNGDTEVKYKDSIQHYIDTRT